MKYYFLREGKVRLLKPDADITAYLGRHPDARRVCAPPTQGIMERWIEDGVAKATDGCRVEPDGNCPHGHDSYLKVLGYI